jgi:Holliday junction resolvase RusA-like endonuclease
MINGVELTVLGEPASKSNSSRIVFHGRRPRLIKSKKALNYVDNLKKQVKPLKNLLEGDLEVSIDIYYASRRPDLDESLILDALQGLIYSNDRQIKKKNIVWHLDRENPRAIIRVKTLC